VPASTPFFGIQIYRHTLNLGTRLRFLAHTASYFDWSDRGPALEVEFQSVPWQWAHESDFAAVAAFVTVNDGRISNRAKINSFTFFLLDRQPEPVPVPVDRSSRIKLAPQS
jgi:hypothetical protein